MNAHSPSVFFHAPRSRSGATRAMLEALGVPCDLVALNLVAGGQRTPDYLAINPMGKVPAIRDEGVLITEQPAILMYLADLYPEKNLAPLMGDPLRGAYLRWMVFYGSCFEPAMMDFSAKRTPVPPMQCGYGDYDSVMRVVAAQLEQGPWLLGERFTAADVLWGGALNYGLMFKLVPDWPVFRDYAERVQARPAIRRATEMDAALAATQARELDEALAAWKIARARELRRAARASIISPIIGNHPHACFIRSCDRGCDRSCGCAAPSACSSSSMPCRDAAPRCRRIEWAGPHGLVAVTSHIQYHHHVLHGGTHMKAPAERIEDARGDDREAGRVLAEPDLAGPALRTFFNLAGRWKLRIAEQRKLLGDPPESTFYKWKRERDGTLSRDTLERISYLLGIFKALQILFPQPDRADAWLRKPNAAPTFGGRSALERMLSGNVADLYVVRQYLDAQRG